MMTITRDEREFVRQLITTLYSDDVRPETATSDLISLLKALTADMA